MSTPAHADLENRFAYHAPDAQRKIQHEQVRDLCGDTAAYLVANIPDGREKSLALTKIEEAMFWANAAIARAPRE